MKTKKVVYFTFIIMFCLGASFNPLSCDTDISGRITDSVSGESIAGATVTVEDHAEITPATTDANGDYTLTATHNGK